MSYQIYNDTATLKIVENGSTRNLAKAVCGVRDFGDYIVFSYDGDNDYLKILYSAVTVPSSASATALRNTINGYLNQTFSANIDTSSIATSANQTNGSQLTKITDGAGVVNTKLINTQINGNDVALVTNTIIHAYTSSGGGQYVDVKAEPSGKLLVKDDDVITELQTLNSLVPSKYDYISLGYTGTNLTTVVFKTGGSGGTTVSTLTLAYTGSRLDSVTKT